MVFDWFTMLLIIIVDLAVVTLREHKMFCEYILAQYNFT